MKLESQTIDPLIIRLSDEENIVVANGTKYPLETGVMFGSLHHGFTIMVGSGADTEIREYATQCRIVGTQIVEDTLNIYEENKYISWQFDKTSGELKRRAVFSDMLRSEKNYLKETYGIVDRAGIDEINDEKNVTFC